MVSTSKNLFQTSNWSVCFKVTDGQSWIFRAAITRHASEKAIYNNGILDTVVNAGDLINQRVKARLYLFL